MASKYTVSDSSDEPRNTSVLGLIGRAVRRPAQRVVFRARVLLGRQPGTGAGTGEGQPESVKKRSVFGRRPGRPRGHIPTLGREKHHDTDRTQDQVLGPARTPVHPSGSDFSHPSSIPTRITGGLKRGLDLLIVIPALLLAGPIMMVLALWIRAQDGGPAFFVQKRIGHRGREFACIKLRTMAVDATERLEALLAADPAARAEWERDQKLRNDPRVTKFGDFLRRTSLDELPQLFNILRGDMSLVGPRPIVHDEIARYGEYFAYYCAAKPGMTGLWQISGRNDVAYGERVGLDAAYAANWSFLGDIRILLATIPAVLFSRGAY